MGRIRTILKNRYKSSVFRRVLVIINGDDGVTTFMILTITTSIVFRTLITCLITEFDFLIMISLKNEEILKKVF